MLLLLHERDHRVAALGGELAGVAVREPDHVPGELDDRDLHAQADAEEGHASLPRAPDRFDHAVDAAHPEAARYEQPVVSAEDRPGTVPVDEAVTADPGDVDPDIVGDAAVNERLVHTLVAVHELRVLAHDGDPHAHARRDDALHHGAPGREVRLRRLEV